MLRTPRLSPVSGLSTQGLLLVAAGVAAAGFLLVVLPRMASSRAAAPRSGPRVEIQPGLSGRERALDEEPAPRVVELPNPMGLAATPAPGLSLADPAAPLALPSPEAAPASATAASEDEALLAAESKATFEGPKLNYAKRTSKPEVLAPGDVRKQNKVKAKERLEKATEEALAEGKPLPENLRKQAAARSKGEKPPRQNQKGKRPREPKPKDD